jgi:H+/Cl- antiporter ClcA
MAIVVVLAVGIFVVAYQSYVSWRVSTSDMYSMGQKSAQLAIIWLLPILGAGIVHWVHYGQARTPEAPSGKYLEEHRYEDHGANPRIFND